MSDRVGITYEAVGKPGKNPVVYCLMDKSFISAVGLQEMREMFEDKSQVIQLGEKVTILTEASETRAAFITSAIDMAIDNGYLVDVDCSSIGNFEPGAENDVSPSFDTFDQMISDIRERMKGQELRAENDEIPSP